MALVNDGSSFLALSHIFSPATSLLDCFQNFTSQSVRSNQPLPTMPLSTGNFPVKYVDCTDVVTAGIMGSMVVMFRSAMYFWMKGVCSPITDFERPTMSITTVLFISIFLIPLLRGGVSACVMAGVCYSRGKHTPAPLSRGESHRATA